MKKFKNILRRRGLISVQDRERLEKLYGTLPNRGEEYILPQEIEASPNVPTCEIGFEISPSDYLCANFKNSHKTSFFKCSLNALSTPEHNEWTMQCFNNGKATTKPLKLPQAAVGLYEVVLEIPRETDQVRFFPREVSEMDSPGTSKFFCSPTSIEFTPIDTKLAAQYDSSEENARHRAVICFPVIDWEYRNQRPHHIMREFAKQGEHVVYVATRLFGFHDHKALHENVEDRITKVTLPGNCRLNLYKHQPSPRSIEIGCEALMSFLLERAFEDIVLVVQLPFWLPYAEKLKKERGYPIIYDCMDDHSGFENNTPEMLKAEDCLCKNSDLLITTSQKLYDEKSSKHPNTSLIRNAGEVSHFSELPSKEDSPLAHLEGPIVGYFGAIAEWFDCETISYAAEANPDVQFVLIGHLESSCQEKIRKSDNLHLLGELPYKELPKYLAAFDVCTIPFQRIPLTEATNPVKIYEYFASGKPVVSRRLPEVELFSDVSYLYDTPDQFSELLKLALGESEQDPKRKARKKIAKENTWEHRAKSFRTEINKLQKKASFIILSYESLPFLMECVSSIISNTSYQNYDIVVVDNASSNPVRSYLHELDQATDRVKLIQNEENKGFAAGNNQGLKLAYENGSEYFVLLNNDTVVPAGSLERLIYYASQDNIGLVGPVTNNIGNEARIETSYQSTEEMYRVSWGIRNQFRGEHFHIKVPAMFCLGFRREILDKVGYLDESFGIGMFEDDDYAERVRSAGYEVICAEDIFIHHYGSVSFRQLPRETYNQIFEENKETYEKKWGSWIPHTYR